MSFIVKSSYIDYLNQSIELANSLKEGGSNALFESLLANLQQIKLLTQAQEQLLCTHIAENANDLIWQLDHNFELKYISPSVVNLLGISVHDFLLHPINGFLTQKHKQTILNNSVNSTDKNTSIIFEKSVFANDGSLKWFEDKIKPQYNDDELVGYLGVSRDITERKKIELALKRANIEVAEANQSKSDFFDYFSHEMRTPLNAILGFSEILLERLSDSDEKMMINIIQQSGKNLLEMVTDMIDFSKIENGKLELNPEPADLRQTLKGIEEMFLTEIYQKKLLYLEVCAVDLPERLNFDDFRLKQILANLISNAIKFTSYGFIKIVIQTKFSTDKSKVDLRIQVHDTGDGIGEIDLRVIFDPIRPSHSYLSRHFIGDGFMLALTKRLVYLMDGYINLYSEEGKGTVFEIELSRIEVIKEKSNVEKQSPNQHHNFSNIRILFIPNSIKLEYIISKFEFQYAPEIVFANPENLLPLTILFAQCIVIDETGIQYDSKEFLLKIRETAPLTPMFLLTNNIKKSMKRNGALINRYVDISTFNSDTLLKLCADFISPSKNEPPSPTPSQDWIPNCTPQFSQLLPEAIVKLSQIVQKTWKMVIQYDSFGEYNNFANLLLSIGTEYSLQIITDYANELLKLNRNFDIDNLKTHLDKFPEIVERLEEFLNKHKEQ